MKQIPRTVYRDKNSKLSFVKSEGSEIAFVAGAVVDDETFKSIEQPSNVDAKATKAPKNKTDSALSDGQGGK